MGYNDVLERVVKNAKERFEEKEEEYDEEEWLDTSPYWHTEKATRHVAVGVGAMAGGDYGKGFQEFGDCLNHFVFAIDIFMRSFP